MASESNVGLRILVIGKDAAAAAMTELQGAAARLNATIAEGGTSSKVAAAGYAEQGAGLEALGVKMDLYQKNLAAVGAETDAVAKLGKVAFLAMSAAAVAWTYESVKWAQSYQTALVQLRTQAGLTVTAMNAIGAAAMRNSAALGTTPTAYLQAAYHPASTGMSTAETIAITNYAAKEARISGAPLEDTTNSLTSTMRAYNLGASQAGSTIAKLNAIVGSGNMHFSDLNSALASGIASTASTYGVSLTSMGGALARLTDLGTPAAQAGTRLRMAIALLGAPSKAASTLIQDAGMTSSAAADSQNALSQTLYAAGVQPTQLSSALENNSGKGGIYNALELLHKNLAGSGMSKEMQDAFISRSFGGGRMGTSIMQLYSNLGALGQKSNQITQGSTSAKYNADWAATTKTLDFQLHKLGGTVETLGTTFGVTLLPPLTKALSLFTDLLGLLDKNKGIAIGLATAITAVLAPAIGVYLYRALLSSGGAIRTVLQGYANLISGNTQEQIALSRTDAALAGNDAALATNDKALLTNTAERDGTGGIVGGTGVGIGGKLGVSALGLTAGYLGGNLIRGKSSVSMTNRQSAGANVRSLLGDMGEGAAAGAVLGNAIPIPGVGAGIGAGVGAVAGGVVAEHASIEHGLDIAAHHIKSLGDDVWDKIFGGGPSASSARVAAPAQNISITLYLDGKDITKSVRKQIKATASRS
jgi:TP901 family phage tail tape measure protein